MGWRYKVTGHASGGKTLGYLIELNQLRYMKKEVA
jgi:hypothetical protein